ncbi:peptidase domain-containing ABC transporter [Saccharibacillus sp. JS10]|uniref:peptidase domain-containing ABC transporter n=1 Tax=Saccharibacillus sp. JS10 TaxID=2950552 RepID=UPI00210A05E0|nr:peptidase domain-containing ABC transporter [Saccharibacillus sp. JS10]MCQ4087446.1 peptidase domain-containing ABC transporter [Saccharibacillus sp. JS10]
MLKARMPFIEQMEDSECGIACLAMVMARYGCRVSLHEIRERYGVSRGGSSLLQLITIASGYSMKSKAFRCRIPDLRSMPLPVIAHWEGKHFVVIEKVGKHRITIVDPSFGRRTMRIEEAEEKYSGHVLCAVPDENFQKRKGRNDWGFFVKLALKQPRWLFAILGVSLLLQSFGLIAPGLTAWITDSLLIGGERDLTSMIGLALISLFVFYEVFAMLRGWLVARLQSVMDLNMMQIFIERLFRLPYSFFESRTGGELMFRTNANVYIRQILSNRMVTIVIDFILLISYAGLMLVQAPKLALTVIGTGAFIFSVLIVTTLVTKKFSSREITEQSRTQSFLAECIYGITDIKLSGAEKRIFDSWRGLFVGQLEVTQKRNIWVSLLESFSTGIQFILPLLLLWGGSAAVLSGQMTIGGLLGFNALAMAFMIPIVSLGSAYTQLLTVGSYLQRIHDVIEAQPEQQDGFRQVDELEGSVQLSNVSYRYSPFTKEAVTGLNMQIEPGQKIAIVGPSGSGKTTLAKLLLGFYTPTAGEVRYDGQPLQELDLRSLRKKVGSILQDTRLFQRTIEENIRMMDDSITLEQVVQAAQRASIHDDIMQLPLGYSTLVSESGANLSGGQRQRLLLARALVTEPRILLLDEATSALDNLSQARIEESLSVMKCTRIVIAHRLSTVMDADRIIVMDGGSIVESGNHRQLLKQKGLYYNLYMNKGEENHEMVI